jgi:formimidoylglutamate deiminase
MPAFVLYLPEMLFADDMAHGGLTGSSPGLLVDEAGNVSGLVTEDGAPAGTKVVRMPGKALLPGLANAHSHTFQRLFRGRAENRAGGPAAGGDTFWTWREQMYRAAKFVSPDQLYDVARATFLEMAAAGITAVGEFHYLHRDAHGNIYDDPNLLSHKVIAAAQSVGLRICLLRTAYFRAGFELPDHPGQRRFYETPEQYLRNLEELQAKYIGVENVTVGAAPHSIRAVPLDRLKEIAAAAHSLWDMPLHMHISEQVAENAACEREYGRTPVALLAEHGILSAKTTLVHAIHVAEAEYGEVADSGATICSCPTTERNLGDGIFPADVATRLGIPVAFGTDSQAQIDILEDARQMEYHLRLRDQQRGILDAAARDSWATREPIEKLLLRSASANGYRALDLPGGRLATGEPADFFTVDLNDLSGLGVDVESLASQAVFSMAKSAVRDVAVAGKLILENGRHPQAGEIRAKFRGVVRKFAEFAG